MRAMRKPNKRENKTKNRKVKVIELDQRIVKLADNLIDYSCKLQKGERILISLGGTAAAPLVRQLVKKVYAAGGIPFVETRLNAVERELLMHASKEQYELLAEVDAKKMEQMDAYIGIRAYDNPFELADVPSEKMSMYNTVYVKPVHHDIRLKKKWVVLSFPNNSMAQSANVSLEEFEDFYYKVCNLDYKKLSDASENLKVLMDKTERVRITGCGTDLSFSIKGLNSIKCAGEMNIPDGEVYTAPVKDSVNGKLTVNTPSEYEGFTYESVVLEFKDGKIINASANDTERINKVLDSDEGARYIGEFAIGINPYILTPMKNTLFDEKIMGSFHFTPGNCYEDADNGNKSVIHWDLVTIQRPEYGGGEIYFDDVLIRKDGLFVVPELLCLNPENFM